MSIFNKSGYLAAVAAFAVCMGASAATTQVDDYLADALSVIPDQCKLSVYEVVRFNDNIKNSAVHERESFEFKTGLNTTIFKKKGDLEYGINGDVSYDYYTHDSGELNQFDWNVLPYFKGMLDDINNLKITVKSVSNVQSIDGRVAKFARHYDTGASATYEYVASGKTGVMLNADYLYKVYTQHEFKDRTYQNMEFSIAPYYNVTEKLRTGIRGVYSQRYYESTKQQNDSYKWTINAFAKYRMNAFFNLYTEAGLEKKAFEGKAKGTNGDRDWNGDFQVALNYLPTSRWNLQLRSKLASDDSFSGDRGMAYVWDNRITAKFDATKNLRFEAFAGLEQQDEKINSMDTDEWYFSFKTSYKFTENLSAFASYKYNNVQYKYNGDADYDVNEYSVGVSYLIKK